MRAPCVILPNKTLSTCAPYLFINVTHVSNSEEPSVVVGTQQSVVLVTQLTLPKSMGNNTIFLFQKV